MMRTRLPKVVALAGLLVALGGCAGAMHGSGAGGQASLAAPSAGRSIGASTGASRLFAPAPGKAVKGSAPAPAPPPGVGQGPRVIRAGQLTLKVPAGRFDSKFDDLTNLVGQEGGYIAGTTANSPEGPIRQAVITFELPASNFQDAINKLRKMGQVDYLQISGQDVTAQYVDLEARLGNEEAQRTAMLTLLARATTIQDILSIQDQLGQITQQIEEYKGQIGLMDHETTYSTIAVTLEASPAAAQSSGGLGHAWSQMVQGFVNTLGGMLIGLGAAGPVLLVLLGLGYGGWRWWRWREGRGNPPQAAVPGN